MVRGENDVEYLQELASIINELSQDRTIVVVCGGGKIARYYISHGRALGGTEEELDWCGIAITRLNATLLNMALGEGAVEEIPETVERAGELATRGKMVTMGGTVPGHTTDAVSAMVASHIGADRIVNATSVDAVYSEDPREDASARRFTSLTFEDFHEMVKFKEHGAGQTAIFDSKGARIAMENRIPIFVVKGRALEEIKNAILGDEIDGTVISE